MFCKNKLKYWLFLASFFVAFACVEQTNSTQEEKKQVPQNQELSIVCTTGMIADAVENIVGNTAKVQTLMGAGIDPHLYKATTGDIALLSSSDLIVYNGLHLEGKMSETLEKLKSEKQVLAVAESLLDTKGNGTTVLRQVGEATYDPHVWMSLPLWQVCLKKLIEDLSLWNPEKATLYRENGKKYLTAIENSHQKIVATFNKIPKEQRVLITSHDAFFYFGKTYDLEVMPIMGISTASEAGLADINRLVSEISKRKIKAIFVESSISDKDVKSIIEGCKKTGHNLALGGVLYADAMGEKSSKSGTYLGMMESNAETIATALQ
ncbi:metal ABC transporter solute-binding protein, Zn/Mn family [Hugenholtzia roseola]|uniref:metal ABC transporter solute-binding protein, Zn/Mn family n=1 Tax=Hugenholtzia roseola TaxID=1002 RepID=UPI000408F4F1|nr:zinc ABC transporter substrate-binding protein [Hugenholtzia roseola]